MEITIRPAVEGDYDGLCELIDRVDELHRDNLPRRFRASEGPARSRSFILKAIDASDTGLFVAEFKESLAGFIRVIVRDTPPVTIFVPRRYAVVDNLAVRDSFRRSGIGRALMERAETWAKGKGATSIELNVYAFNRPAMSFYQRLEYHTLSHRLTKRLE
jgi:ribosomal protein S18 acetylase RimI-like enzyme